MKNRRVPIQRGSFLLLLAAAIAGAMHHAGAGERILDFDSVVELHADGTQTVTETIRVFAEGREIRHGIFRDLPMSRNTPVEVLSVSVDGKDAPGLRKTSTVAGGIRIRMGPSDQRLSVGGHTFVLVYKSQGHVVFNRSAELGWNVTGSGWTFTIEEARCRVVLPPGGEIEDAIGWLGRPDSRESPIRIARPESNAAEFAAERAIKPGEDFTVAVRFPRHLVADPGRATTARSALVVALSLAFFFITWWFWGRDPKPDVIVPLFYPPVVDRSGRGAKWRPGETDRLSAAAASYIKNATFFDTRAFASLFVSLAVQGLCRIEKEKSGDFAITLLEGEKAVVDALPQEEWEVYKRACETTVMGERFVLSDQNASSILKMHENVVAALGERYAPLWLHNMGLQALGWLVVFPVGVWLVNRTGGNPLRTLLPWILLAGLIFLVRKQIASCRARSINNSNPLKFAGRTLYVVLAVSVRLFGSRLFYPLLGAVTVLWNDLLNIDWATVCLIALPTIFNPVMKAPTRACRRLLDKIDGLRMYINVAELEQLRFENPPEETPATFSRLLPYAVAFGLEDTWCARFASALKADAVSKGRDIGVPRSFYQTNGGFRSFENSLVAASKIPAPTAKGGSGGSFFGGGGGAGRGGGGGGGGGW